MADKLKEAIKEAEAYARLGGLDDQMIKDIAFDFKVKPKDIYNALVWENPED